mmetsp:Transcript_40832/g.94730  ORF Transcript_40832/g.94730 Transcript_40832/m.94730 type:complete len:227 (-) Transcript_40832:86-766(-)
MPLRVERMSRKRLCLLVLKARRRKLGRETSPPWTSWRKMAKSPRASPCRSPDDEPNVARQRAQQRKLKCSPLQRMYRIHSLRNIARLIRGGSPCPEEFFWEEYEDSDIESEDVILPCGLGANEAVSMMHRELTPEDYEKLCKLDEAIPNRNTLEAGQVNSLPRLRVHGKFGGECGVCLSALGSGEVVKLPCSHLFHKPCITKWLTQFKNTCPICSVPIEQAAVTPA